MHADLHIGIEIPNHTRDQVFFRDMVESSAFINNPSLLNLALGVDVTGSPVLVDLTDLPHLLIAGAASSGKSVALSSIIMSILYKASPDQVRFLMIDTKGPDLAFFRDIPHLAHPVLSTPDEAIMGLKWAVAEMERRFKMLGEKSVRNIDAYNSKIKVEIKDCKSTQDNCADAPRNQHNEMPFLVVIIDELADLMMVAAQEVENYITQLAQKAQTVGIHMVIATNRPSVDVLSGIIKANMPTRISFRVYSRIDSRTILNQMGAEKLLGQGDMLFQSPWGGKVRRLHGTYVSDNEITRATDFIRAWGPPDYIEER